jgi:hypothetical protein
MFNDFLARAVTTSLVVLVGMSLGCGGNSPSPTQPTPPPRAVVPSGPAATVADVTLSGMVYEVTPIGRMPIEGVRVFLTDDQDIATDRNGFFSFRPVWLDGGNAIIWVSKDGFDDVAGQPIVPGYNEPGWHVVPINGDTRFDVQLVRQ